MEGESINPVHFFSLKWDCPELLKKKDLSTPPYLVPSTQHLTGEGAFAKLFMGWTKEGIFVLVKVDNPLIASFYPEVEQGDSLELFFDTRDVKTSGFNTLFCHHFFFLPKEVDGVSKGEKTHFRGEETRSLCDPMLLELHSEVSRKGYEMTVFIPADCLHGYDPLQFDRLGFTYRLNRLSGLPQHFSVVSNNYSIEQQPSLWASVALVRT